ncbi:solute carrier family 5 (high affinity choline transporter), member 7 [Sarotherodon galilaeus]
MNKSEENEQNADQGSFQREDKETFFSRVQTNLSALSSIITAPVESVGRLVIFVTRHIFNIGRATFTSPTSETEKSSTSETTEVPSPSISINNVEYEQSPSSETTKIPTTGVNMNNAKDQSYSTDLFNVGLPEPSDNGPEDNEQNVIPGSLQTEEEETISSRVQTNVPNLYSSCRVPDVPVGLREAFITRHLLNISRAPFTSVTTPTSETSETATVSKNNFGHEESPTNESYSIDLFNVGLPESSDNRSEENEQNIVQGTLEREDEDPVVSRIHRNLSGFNSLITAPVVLAGQGVIFVTRHILNICGAPFTSLFNHFFFQQLFSVCLIPTIRRWLDVISWMTSAIGALALLVLLIILLKIVIMVTH